MASQVKREHLPMMDKGLNRFRYDDRLTNRVSYPDKANLVWYLRPLRSEEAKRLDHEVMITDCVAYHLFRMALEKHKWVKMRKGDWDGKDLKCLTLLDVPFKVQGEVVYVEPREEQWKALYYLIGTRKEDEYWEKIARNAGFKPPEREPGEVGRPSKWYKPVMYPRNRPKLMRYKGPLVQRISQRADYGQDFPTHLPPS